MKMTQEWYDRIKTGFNQIADYYGGPSKIKTDYASLSTERLSWDMYHILMHNWSYDDTHPFYVDGTWARIIPHCDVNYHTLYNLGLNDSHIRTALKRIVKELGLVD